MKVKFTDYYKEFANEVALERKEPIPFDLEAVMEVVEVIGKEHGDAFIKTSNGGVILLDNTCYEVVEE